MLQEEIAVLLQAQLQANRRIFQLMEMLVSWFGAEGEDKERWLAESRAAQIEYQRMGEELRRSAR